MGAFCFNLYFWPVFIVLTVISVTLCLPLLVLGRVFCRQYSVASMQRRLIRFYGRVLVCIVPFLRPVRIVYKGAALPQPAILVPNHTSSIDPFVFGALPLENAFVTSWPFKIPVYSLFMRLAHYVDVRKGWSEVAIGVEGLLNEGSSVTIWPEGHRTRTGEIGRFRRGAFELAVSTGIPIVPICITGSRTVMPAGQMFLQPAQVTLTLLDPIYPRQDREASDEVVYLRDTVRAVLVEELASC